MKLIKINSNWCLSCIYMNGLLNDIKIEYQTIDLDYDEDKEKIEKYNIGKILPVYILIDDNGMEVNRIVGEKNIKELKSFLLLDREINYEK